VKKYDGIIIGAGPNGLTVGAYLAKAGLKVLLLDKRYEMGGGLATEQVTTPGFLHDTHAIYHMMVDYAPPLKDFKLEDEYDLKWIYPDIQVVMPFSDGNTWLYIKTRSALISQSSNSRPRTPKPSGTLPGGLSRRWTFSWPRPAT